MATAIDPICHMKVDPATALSLQVNGDTHYFCSAGCRTRFAREQGVAVPEPPTSPGGLPIVTLDRDGGCCPIDTERPKSQVIYTCPMHPEIEQAGPGACPICGMDLEPKTVARVEEEADADRMLVRFWIATALSVPLAIIDMAPMIGLPLPGWLQHGRTLPWIEFALATPVVWWCGWPILRRGWQSLRRSLNMFTLISIGVLAAYLFSTTVVLFPRWLPAAFTDDGHLPLYFEASAVIIAFVLLGQVMERGARKRTGSAIRELMELAPTVAHRIKPNALDL
jgi:Cu+-exporting ATPase